MTARAGSILIYCLGIATLALIIGYGFLRAAVRDIEAGNAGQQYLLAMEAARAGTVHAVECISEAYAATTLAVGAGAGGSVTVSSPPTFLDGPWRAPFTSFTNPSNAANVDPNLAYDPTVTPYQPVADDDLRLDNHALLSYAFDPTDRRRFWRFGAMIDPARGRWLEVGYHNRTRPAPTASPPVPIAPTRFNDPGAALPERAAGTFLDRDFARLAGGSAVDDRRQARYRLRYAVTVVDLEGQLLINPLPGMDADWRSAAAGFRAPPAAYPQAPDAMYNLAQGIAVNLVKGSDPGFALRVEHLFRGRGSCGNADRDPGTGLPVTFPTMYRNRATGSWWGAPANWWGHFTANQTPIDTASANKYKCRDLRNAYDFYRPGTATGGDALPAAETNSSRPIMHAWTGPQASWVNAHYAGVGHIHGDGMFDGSNGQFANLQKTATLFTPFGRPPAATRPDAATPWRINLLTAPPRAIHCLLLALLPPQTRSTTVSFFNASSALIATVPLAHNRDLYTSLVPSGAFAEYAAPVNAQRDLRAGADRYPGGLWNGGDALGENIDADSVLGYGWCSHTGRALVLADEARKPVFDGDSFTYGMLYDVYVGTTTSSTRQPPVAQADIPAAAKFRCDYTGAYSYWWDLLAAFTSATTVVKAQWVQYPTAPTSVVEPAATFSPATFRDPSAFATLVDVDRLFLRQLGENYANPGSGGKVAGVAITRSPLAADSSLARNLRLTDGDYTASNTIRTLLAADPTFAAKAKVMERVLNDFRMNLLGSNPDYGDFRPLDFDGDGAVQASCYPSSGDPVEQLDGTDHHRPVDATHALPGRGPIPERWFCLAGHVFIGRSRFYRILSRGEVYDNLLGVPIADMTQESAVVVDPDGTGRMGDNRVIFQRWQKNSNATHLTRIRE